MAASRTARRPAATDKSKAAPKAKTTKKNYVPIDAHQVITDQIIAALEKGARPWQQPWKTLHRPLRVNGQPYRGINVLVLWLTAQARGYTHPTWMTFEQAKALGGYVRGGEHGTKVVYFKTREITEAVNEGEDPVTRAIPFARTFTVFNCDQIDSLPAKFAAPVAGLNGPEARISEAEEFFKATGMDIRHGGDGAYYVPSMDYVQMPLFNAFKSAEAYYYTLGHEGIHWTGHKSRLDRNLERRYTSDALAMEELVAEIGASFVGADLGLASTVREENAAYIAHWLKVMRGDKRAIFNAASLAEKAAKKLHESAAANGYVSAAPEGEAEGDEPTGDVLQMAA